MTSPLTPEAVAQMCRELRLNHGNPNPDKVADMLTALAAELATLRASESAAREMIAEWQEARKACIESTITLEQLSRLGSAEAALALTPPTTDGETP